MIYDNVERVVIIEDAKLGWTNFEGKEDNWGNTEKYLDIYIPDDNIAQQMSEDGWNVKIVQPKQEGDPVRYRVRAFIGYKNPRRLPKIIQENGDGTGIEFDEDSVHVLAGLEMYNIDVALRGNAWEQRGDKGVKAYVQEMHFQVKESYLGKKYRRTHDEEM